MLDGIRTIIRLESISGDFIRTAQVLRVSQIVVHNLYHRTTSFLVNAEDRDKTDSQRGVLHISVEDLAAVSFPDNFDFKDIAYIELQKRIFFTLPIKIGSIEIGKGVSIGGKTIIGHGVKIGEQTQIGMRCDIESSQIGKKVLVRRDTKLSNVNIGDHAEVGPDAMIDNSGLGVFEIGSWVKIEAWTILRGQGVAPGSLIKPR